MESVAAQAQAQAETQSDLPLSNNAMSALGYFCGLVAIGALFIKPYDKNKQVRFHAIQALLFQASWAVAYLALAIVTMILTSIASMLLGTLKLYALLGVLMTVPTTLSLIFSLGMTIAWVVLIVSAAQGKTIRLPVLAKFADQQVSRM